MFSHLPFTDSTTNGALLAEGEVPEERELEEEELLGLEGDSEGKQEAADGGCLEGDDIEDF